MFRRIDGSVEVREGTDLAFQKFQDRPAGQGVSVRMRFGGLFSRIG
jgi:hypothetical protein